MFICAGLLFVKAGLCTGRTWEVSARS
jgi:hypothetical protein